MPIEAALTAQVPIEGEKEGGVEWVADQAAITVQELREVEKDIKVFLNHKISCQRWCEGWLMGRGKEKHRTAYLLLQSDF